MIALAHLDLLYKSALLRTIRLLIFALLLLLCIADLRVGNFPKFPLFFLGFFVMSEIFYHFHIASFRPAKKIKENSTDAKLSCTKTALEKYLTAPTTGHMIRLLLRENDVLTFLARLGAVTKNINILSVEKEQVLMNAKEVASQTGGVYITRLDLLCSYLLLTEGETKMLFAKEVKPEELLTYLRFVRTHNDEKEYPHSFTLQFDGEGFGEALVTGWTPLTKLFTTDWTWSALSRPRLLFGREGEYKQLVEALSKQENNNVLLIGESGVGRETLLTALVHDSFRGVLPTGLNHKRLLELLTSNLLAGASDQGTLQARLGSIIDEVSHAGDVFLYIPEFQHVVGSSDLHLDISGVILPHLRSGRLPIIATMSVGNFKTYLEKNPIVGSFNVLTIEPPDNKTLVGMLLEKAPEIESKYRCILSYKALSEAATLAHVYLPDESVPGSAITLLSDTANAVLSVRGRNQLIISSDITTQIQQKTHISVGVPGSVEKELLLHLEESLHKRVVNQVTAVGAIAEAMRRVRSGLSEGNKPISFLFLGPTGVGKTETAKALADIYFRGEAHMVRLDMSEYADEEGIKRLLGAAPGEGSERGELTDKIHDNPYSLVLLDEFEKANPRILDLFLQVLEEGRLTDNKGRTVSFDNTIIIATSNAASEYIRESVASGKKVDKSFHQELIEYLQEQHIFKPELLNRFDEVITFTPLGRDEVGQIVKLLLQKLVETMREQDINLVYSEDVVKKIADEGYDPQFGARPLKRYIQNRVEDVIAKMKLEDKLVRGSKASLTVGETGDLLVTVGT
ncbi:MAG: AAA family ATPase [bacterium]|nr:AAA family ATPase [bacterium]